MFSFFIMALQILITKIEFNIFASIAVILSCRSGPSGIRISLSALVFPAVFAFGVKLMVMFFLIGLVQTICRQGRRHPKDAVTFVIMLKYAISYLIGYLVWKSTEPGRYDDARPASFGCSRSPSRITVSRRRIQPWNATLPVHAGRKACKVSATSKYADYARIRANGGTLYNSNHEPFQTAGSGRTVKNEFCREIFRQKFGFLSGNVEKALRTHWNTRSPGVMSVPGHTQRRKVYTEYARCF